MNRVRFYRRFNNWRWVVKSVSGKKIGASTEGYKNRGDAVANFVTLTGRQIVGGYAKNHVDEWAVAGL